MCELSVNNFIALRTAHQLSVNKLALLLGFKWASSAANIEKGKTMITTDTLITLSNLFGVSIDWILGRSSLPYTEESVAFAENLIIKKLKDADKRNEYFPEVSEYLYFKSDDDRKKNYSLAVRANILFLLNIYELPNLVHRNTYFDMLEDPNYSKEEISKFAKKKPTFNFITANSGILCLELSFLLSRKQTEPIFNIYAS